MRLPNPLVLGAIYGLSELYLAFTRHTRTQAVSKDRRSLFLLWTIILVSLWLGIQMIWLFPWATVPYPSGFYFLGFILFLAGLALRWYSIGYLGRYFTVDVSISAEHKLCRFRAVSLCSASHLHRRASDLCRSGVLFWELA